MNRPCFLVLALLVGPLSCAAESAPPAEVFFRPDTMVMPQVSPDGRRLTAMMRHDGRRHALALIDLATKNVEVLVKDQAASVAFSSWQDDDLIFFTTELADGGTRMHSIDLRTRKINNLDRLNREGRIQVWVGDNSRFVVCPWVDGGIRRVDVRSGQSTEVERGVPGIQKWVFDARGNLWAGIGQHDGRWTFVWRSAPDKPWQFREEPGKREPTITPRAVMPERQVLLVIERRPEDPTARAAWFDLATGKTRALFAHPELDVEGVLFWADPYGPVAVYSAGERRHDYFINEEAADTHRKLAEALPDHDLAPIGASRNLERLLVRAENSRDRGSFFLLDRSSGQISLVGVARLGLKASQLPLARYFELSSRDGLKLTGRFLAPADVPRPPVVVLLGPQLPTLRWDNNFDGVAQFLASRGFASVRLHVRGTAGFGKAFREAGDFELTGGMVRDLEDGLAWLTAQGWIDEKRVAILGYGMGGITAVHAALTGRYRAWLNVATQMVVRKLEIEELSPSARSRAELTAKLGGRAAVLAYIKTLDPLVAATKVTVPSFHYYPQGESSYEMTESGRLLRTALKSSTASAEFHVDPANVRELDPGIALANMFTAAAAFLSKTL